MDNFNNESNSDDNNSNNKEKKARFLSPKTCAVVGSHTKSQAKVMNTCRAPVRLNHSHTIQKCVNEQASAKRR